MIQNIGKTHLSMKRYIHKFCVRCEFAHREMTKSSKADIIQSCFKNNAVLWVFKMKCEEENLEIDTLTHL